LGNRGLMCPAVPGAVVCEAGGGGGGGGSGGRGRTGRRPTGVSLYGGVRSGFGPAGEPRCATGGDGAQWRGETVEGTFGYGVGFVRWGGWEAPLVAARPGRLCELVHIPTVMTLFHMDKFTIRGL